MSRLSLLPDELFQNIFSYLKTCLLVPVEYHVSADRDVFQKEYFPERKLRVHKWFSSEGHLVRMEKYFMNTPTKYVSYTTRKEMWIWRHQKFLCGYSRKSPLEPMNRHYHLPLSLEKQYRHF
jgi:hypothetical protein